MPNPNYPKILVLGQPFNNNSGGGITLTNLFSGWSKDNIAVLFAPWGNVTITTNVCSTYYQIGENEHKWKFPFNIFKKPFPPSGLITVTNRSETSANGSKTGWKHFLASRIFNPFFNWFGLYHCNSKITLSVNLKKWLTEFRPDIIYVQVSSLESIIFAGQIIEFLKIPSAIHMMDDWPSIISGYGPLKKYWNIKIDKEFRKLLNNVDLHLSICDAMSSEYKERYNKEFTAFHNPIEAKLWLLHTKTDFYLTKKNITILFSGRVGAGITDSLLEVASAIDSINNNKFNIKLHVQTTIIDHTFLQLIQRYKCVAINPVADYDMIPEIFSKADILLLANDFSKTAISFLKFSMPTKASEYMISGTPVLVYAPRESAVSKFFYQNKCGHCVTIQSLEEISKAIKFLIENEAYRYELSNNAVNLAKEKFDAVTVRQKFQNMLLELSEKKTNI
jgi:glycosyltransferase involved in cell wall biosynthesis